MEFLKNHYEKLILGVIIIGLVVAAVLVSMGGESDDMGGTDAPVYEAKAKPLDLTTNLAALSRFTESESLDFEDGHYMFNPGVWQRKPDGSFVTGAQLGPKGLKIKKIDPLKFSVTFADVSSGATPRCSMRITRVNPPGEKGLPTGMTSTLMAVGEENDFFKFLEARPADAPTEVVLEMKKDGEEVTLPKGKTYERIEGYIAELRYDAENKDFRNIREKSSLVLSGETNNVVAVTAEDVVLLNPATTLKTTLKYNAAP